jgi:hypothetical protein
MLLCFQRRRTVIVRRENDPALKNRLERIIWRTDRLAISGKT